MTEQNKYPFVSEEMKNIYSDALKRIQNRESSLEPVLEIFLEHLNHRYQENHRLLEQLEDKNKRLEFLESYLTAVATEYLKKFPEDERNNISNDLTDRLLANDP